MVRKFQAYLTGGVLKGKFLRFFFVALAVSLAGGCATVSSVANIQTKGYGQYVQDVEHSLALPPQPLTTGFYLHPRVQQRVLAVSINDIEQGKVEPADLNLMRKEYLDYAHALIEIGQFRKAWAVCNDGIRIGLAVSRALGQEAKRHLAASLSRTIVHAIFDTSIEPEDNNRTFLRRLVLYKIYIIWFTTPDRDKAREVAFKKFEKFLNSTSLDQDRVFLFMDRGNFYDAIMGNYKRSLDEFMKAAAAVQKMHIFNIDMRYLYSLELSAKISDIYVKLGRLDLAEKTLLDGEKERSGLIYKIGRLIVSLQQSKLSIVRSKMGAIYALTRDFTTSKKYFDEAWDRVRRIDPNSHDIDQQRAIGTYYVYHGAYFLGLQGKYEEAAKEVDRGIRHLSSYYLDAVETEPNIETACLHSAELHLLATKDSRNEDARKAHFKLAFDRTQEALRYAKMHRDSIAGLAAHILYGRIYYDLGERNSALNEYRIALHLSNKYGKDDTENWKLYYGLGLIYEGRGDREEAFHYYKEAIGEVEKLWDGRFKNAERQVSFIDNRLVVFEPMIRLLTEEGKAAQAIHYMEESKSRTFFETSIFNTELQKNSGVAEVKPEDMAKLKKTRERIEDLSVRIDSLSEKVDRINEDLGENVEVASSRGVAGVRNIEEETQTTGQRRHVSAQERRRLLNERHRYKKDLERAGKELDRLSGEEQAFLKKDAHVSSDIGNLKPLYAYQIREMLPRHVAILEYYVGEHSVFGAVISRRHEYVKELSSLTPKQLTTEVTDFRYDVTKYPYSNYEGLGMDLYNYLVRPFKRYLRGIRTVGIVPHGVLHYLPFQALVAYDNSDKGINPDLIHREKTLLAMVNCSREESSRGVGGIKHIPHSDYGSDTGCETFLATRGVGGTRNLKGIKQPIEELDFNKDMAELDSVDARISAERKRKGIKENRPTFLIDQYRLFYAPSSTILNYLEETRRREKDTLLAVGSPPSINVKDLYEEGLSNVKVLPKLPGAKQEVREVGALFHSRDIFTGEAATKTIAESEAPQHNLILFSTHAMLDPINPLKSTIFFSKDSDNNGRLTVSEIKKMRLDANLVTLSACRTGLMTGYGGVSKGLPHGDDLVGLQRAFMQAGSSSVMSTLWEVNDVATSRIVEDFFKRLKDGENKASALQAAELDLMKSEKNPYWQDPYFWAPFVLSGDWR